MKHLTRTFSVLFAFACLTHAESRIPEWRDPPAASLNEEHVQPPQDSREGPTTTKQRGQRYANANGPSLEGSIEYRISGTSVTLRAGRVINRATNRTTGTLRLELWATSQPYNGGGISGYQTATYQFSQQLRPGAYYDNISQTVSFQEPPAGTYYMTLILAEYDGGRYLVVDHGAFSGTARFGTGGGDGATTQGGITIEGRVSYNRVNERITLTAERIVNRGNGSTGSLKLSLWATTTRYSGGSITGFETSSIDLAALGANRQYTNLSNEVAFRSPPAGTYWVSMLLSQWSGSAWLIVDHRTFDEQLTIGGGGANPSGRLQLGGVSTYQINGTQVRITTERIENTMSRSSNALRLELWASSNPYNGGTLTGWVVGLVRFGETLGPNQRFSNVDHVTNLESPPAGTYYMTLLLVEQDGAEFTIRDSRSFPDRQTFGDNATRAVAVLTSPADGSAIAGACVTLQWQHGVGALSYHVEAGRSTSSTEYYGQNVGYKTSQQVCGLPQDNSVVHVRLWTHFGGDDWRTMSYTFRSAAADTQRTKAEMIGPTNNSAISTCTTFRWNEGSGVEEYYLEAGSSPSRSEFLSASTGRSTSKEICGLPAGSDVSVRLWSRWGADWHANSYSYTVAGGSGGDSKSGVLRLAPEILTGCSTALRKVDVLWNFDSSTEVQIRVNAPNGTPMTGWNRGPGSATAEWVVPGVQFFLVNRAGRVLAVVTARTDCASRASITANPELVTRCSSGLGVTSVLWNAPGVSSVRVRVGSPTGADMTGLAGSQGTAVTGNWVQNGTTFILVDLGNRELARTVVGLACE